MIYAGIDTGTNTGVALWDTEAHRFVSIETVTILEAIDIVKALAQHDKEGIRVRFEDARQRQYIPRERDIKQRIGRAIGAGMVMRDCNIWEDFLKGAGIAYDAVAPKDNRTKLTAATFKSWTNWAGRTNEHERDAAMLVFGF